MILTWIYSKNNSREFFKICDAFMRKFYRNILARLLCGVQGVFEYLKEHWIVRQISPRNFRPPLTDGAVRNKRLRTQDNDEAPGYKTQQFRF